jgi:hypothetical protein
MDKVLQPERLEMDPNRAPNDGNTITFRETTQGLRSSRYRQ